MNQIAVGKFIIKKRKEQNLTQEQLAVKLGVSNKTISKWETGKCMPDYSIVELLCKELNTTLPELMNGEEDERSIHTYDNEQIIIMMHEIQRLRKIENDLKGYIMLVFAGISSILSSLSNNKTMGTFNSWALIIVSFLFISFGIHYFAISNRLFHKIFRDKKTKNKTN